MDALGIYLTTSIAIVALAIGIAIVYMHTNNNKK